MKRRTSFWTALLLLRLVFITVALSASHTVLSRPLKVIENSIGMKLVLVPSGIFMMGSREKQTALALAYPTLEQRRFDELFDEAPVHPVRISHAFFLGQHEVTVGQFRRFIEASGYVPESEADGTGGYGYNAAYEPDRSERGDAFEGRDPKYGWRNPGFPQSDQHPVLNVTWNDAVALAKWLSRQEGVAYRLPTEAEWEYACRAGSRTRYHNGSKPDGLLKIANTFDGDAAENWPDWKRHATLGSDGHAFTAPVGSFSANAFGLYDMSGNAWEWVGDWYDENYYRKSPKADPPGPAEGNNKVRRGGSWHTWPIYTRCSYRNWNSRDTRYTLVGIRLLREVKPGGH
jgi:formylglycine-generating enzyme required for sulfatase activity